jgi:hypothetical protein
MKKKKLLEMRVNVTKMYSNFSKTFLEKDIQLLVIFYPTLNYQKIPFD